MFRHKIFLIFLLFLAIHANGQSEKIQQGLFYKSGTSLRLGSVQILNKRNSNASKSNI